MKNAHSFRRDEAFAQSLDAGDPLSSLRQRFHMPPGTVYMLGNSLGLLPEPAEAAVERIVDEWRRLAVGGWLAGDPPWFYLAERTGQAAAPLVGASPDEVICTGTTTFNVHTLTSTFYGPSNGRTKILACALDFPTDIYALKSQISLRGLDWHEHLVLIGGNDEGLIDEDEIVEKMTNEVSIAQLPAVLYRSSQLLDIERLTTAARERGITIGFDCSHSVGVVPHRFDDWGVDYAMWCGYKYLCGGPGAPAFIYLNQRHFEREPGLAGWFGYVKERQFELNVEFEHAQSAGGWQVSSPGILGAAAVSGALEVIIEAGIDRIREKSLRMTSYLMYLVDELLSGKPYGFRVLTPRDSHRRGGHVAVTRDEHALHIKEALAARGVVADFRPPNVIRFAPSPLYSSYHDVWTVVRRLREVVDSGEQEGPSAPREQIT
jgi:kynureninase